MRPSWLATEEGVWLSDKLDTNAFDTDWILVPLH